MKKRIPLGIAILLVVVMLSSQAQASWFSDLFGFIGESSENEVQEGFPKNFPEFFSRADLQKLVNVSTGTLSTDEPDRLGTSASITQHDAMISIDPEQLILQGYYAVTGRGFLQCGEYQISTHTSEGSALQRNFNSSDVSIRIVSGYPERYGLMQIYGKETERKFGNVTKTQVDRSDTVLSRFTEETAILENDEFGNSFVIGLKNETYYVVEDSSNYQDIQVEKELQSLNLSGDNQFYLRICAPNGTSDIFDIRFVFGNTSILLPAPTFNTSTQSDWNQGTFNGTNANTSGYLVLNKTKQEIGVEIVNTTGLVLLFHLNNNSAGESNTQMLNFAGYENATCTGTTCPNISAGYISKTSEFDGSNDYLKVLEYNQIRYVGSNITLMAWIEPDFNLSHASNREVMRKAAASGNDAYRMFFSQADDQYKFRIEIGAASNDCDTQLGINDAPVNVWHHLAATYDGANMKVFWDGKLNNTCATTGTIKQTSGNFFIGSKDASTSPFDGKIDEVAVWNRSLSSSEVINTYHYQLDSYLTRGWYQSKIFDAGDNATYLKFQWSSQHNHSGEIAHGNFNVTNLTLLLHFDQDSTSGESSNLSNDFSGNGHNATCSAASCPTGISSGVFRGAFTYNGSAYLDLANTSALNVSNNFTVSVWVKPSNYSAVDSFFVSKHNQAFPRNGWALGVESTSKKFMFLLSCASTNYYFYSDSAYDDQEYHHVVLRRQDGVSNAFVDGVKQAESINNSPCEGNNGIRLGSYFTDSSAYLFKGTVDELAVFGRPLSDSEVSDIYNRKYGLIKAQVRSCADSGCSTGAYTANSSDSPYTLNLSLTPNYQYFQYRLFLEDKEFNSTPFVSNAQIVYVLRPVISGLTNLSTDNESSLINWSCDQSCNYSLSWYNDSSRTSAYLLGTIANVSFAETAQVRITGLRNFTSYYLDLKVWGVGSLNSSNTTFSFQTRKNYANENEGDTILSQAVQNALLSGYTISAEQQVYVSYSTSNQQIARFDQVATKGNKTWALSYGTNSDTPTGMRNVSPVLYVFELVNRTPDHLLFEVESFINQTK